MQFITIPKFENETAKKIFQAYTTTFPPEERRNETQFLALFSNPKVKVKSIQNNGLEIGYLVLWYLSDFVFLEHFEVFLEYRNQKFGEKILEKLKEIYPNIILESEPSFFDEIAKRRIYFYKRNGFFIIDKTYIQPSYDDQKPSVPMFLLATNPHFDTEKITQEIHQKVYQK